MFYFSLISGEDDINDVAAMGGVNLAEETQRILGSTEFVGTQIRSCKDEILLPQNSLVTKIKHIGNYNDLYLFNFDIPVLLSLYKIFNTQKQIIF